MLPKEVKEGAGASAGDVEYEPFDHREVPSPTSDYDTFIHLVKGCVGTGILALPEAFKFAGIWFGLIAAIAVGLFSVHTISLLLRSQYTLCKLQRKPYLNYPDSFRESLLLGPRCLRCLAPAAPILTDFLLCLYQIGTCSVYILFVSLTMKEMFAEFCGIKWNTKIFVLITFIPFLLIFLVPNLKALVKFSTFGNVLIGISLLIIYVYIFKDLPKFDYPFFGHEFIDIPLFIGTILFAIQAVGVVVALEFNMETPQHMIGYTGILCKGFMVSSIIYAFTGFFGYWRYGKDIHSSITYNLPQRSGWTQAVNVMYCLAIYVSYALQGFVPVVLIWNNYLEKRLGQSKHPLLWEYFLRFIIVIISYILALSIPMLGPFISILGAFVLSTLGIIFPALMDICVHWTEKNFGRFFWILWKDILVILIGLGCFIAGTASAVLEIIQNIKEGKD